MSQQPETPVEDLTTIEPVDLEQPEEQDDDEPVEEPDANS